MSPLLPLTCLIVDDMHPSIEPLLAELNIQADYQPAIPAAEVPEILGQYDGLIVRSKLPISAELLRAAPRLQFIGRAGAGVDNIDEAALAARNVRLFNAPEGNRDAVGEFAVGMLLALLRNIPRADAQVRQGEWLREANRGTELGQLTVGIIGYGNMGAAFARRLSGFGCRVLACDLHPEKVTDGLATYAEAETLRQQADVISLHVPLTPQTRDLINKDWLAQCAKPIWLLNTARGEVVNTADLCAALQSGQVLGAALDVLENEKLSQLSDEQAARFTYLRDHPRVIFTPHIGGWSFASYQRINEVLMEKLRLWRMQPVV